MRSLAQDCGARAVCAGLSGTGADGSAGLMAVRENGGLVIAQEPKEAAHAGMPRSAILTGVVDLVLPAAAIPAALIEHSHRSAREPARAGAAPAVDDDDRAATRPGSSVSGARSVARLNPPTREGTLLRQMRVAGWRWRR